MSKDSKKNNQDNPSNCCELDLEFLLFEVFVEAPDLCLELVMNGRVCKMDPFMNLQGLLLMINDFRLNVYSVALDIKPFI